MKGCPWCEDREAFVLVVCHDLVHGSDDARTGDLCGIHAEEHLDNLRKIARAFERKFKEKRR